MKTVYIIRDIIGRNQCLGSFIVINEKHNVIFARHSLERGWLNNQKNISCVPAGTYPLKLEYSPRFDMDLWEIYDVPNRSECKIHAANFWEQLNGCIAPGEARFNIGRDSHLDMVNSGDTLQEFLDCMGDDTEARIVIINDRR